MKSTNYLSISEVAKLLGISRIAVYKKVKKGQIKAVRIGRSFAIPSRSISKHRDRYKTLNKLDKKNIRRAVKKTVREYGETLRLLGRE
ncbi:MAG: helix-turn-helix domain-containing protein [Candidatus Omnitrophota bacterium]|nr:helix-turn-helix domain-containing protein [Candidatus Omnitrophota bacterium]